jgi:phospholipid/cholesterol/gamma-HCH transport system substrate-binding protein
MQIGAPVRYRGVTAGKISDIRVSANYAEVDVQISPATTVIPRNVTIEAKQSGLVGETFIDITPNTQLPEAAVAGNPLALDCNEDLIVCNGSYLQGTSSVTLTELLGSMIRFTNLFSSPEFFGELRTLTRNFASAASGVDTLSGEVTTLSQSVRSELGTLSNSAERSAESIGAAANQIGLTAGELQTLLVVNRTSLVGTLDNLNQTVSGVKTIVNSLAPVIEEGEFLANLENLSLNASEASANLRNLSEAVGTSENILLLQQTLDSARATFQNAQKITADLDELTGDPNFRQNILRLVNGLSGLVSSAEQLQEHTQLAESLSPAELALNAAEPSPPTLSNQSNKTDRSSTSATDGSATEPAAKPTEATEIREGEIPVNFGSSLTSPSLVTPLSRTGSAQDLLLPNNGLQEFVREQPRVVQP